MNHTAVTNPYRPIADGPRRSRLEACGEASGTAESGEVGVRGEAGRETIAEYVSRGAPASERAVDGDFGRESGGSGM